MDAASNDKVEAIYICEWTDLFLTPGCCIVKKPSVSKVRKKNPPYVIQKIKGQLSAVGTPIGQPNEGTKLPQMLPAINLKMNRDSASTQLQIGSRDCLHHFEGEENSKENVSRTKENSKRIATPAAQSNNATWNKTLLAPRQAIPKMCLTNS